MTRITIDDFRSAGICPRARHWFVRHGLDWRAFVKDGIDLADLRSTGDAQSYVDRVEAAARERLANG